MRLVYLPDSSAFFLWSDVAPADGVRALPGMETLFGLGEPFGQPGEARLVLPAGVGQVAGLVLPLLETVARLAVVPASDVASLPASIAVWTLASKLALALAARERMAPVMISRNGKIEACWAAALSGSEDAARVAAIAGSMPPAAHAVPVQDAAPGTARDVWAPEALLRAFLDDTIDALVRAAPGGPGAEKPAGRAGAHGPGSLAGAAAPSRGSPW
ncbi:MAG TPA: ATP-dependent helicase, partial [Haliangium sp.]|nr:ATP-dependent helicase [Haliangium sp.]